MKKQIKEHIAKILLLVGTSSIVAESCIPNEILYTQNDFAKDSKLGATLLPIHIYIDERVNINGILSFVNDVLSDPYICKEFSKHPDIVLAKYGLDGLDKEDPQLQILVAMADSDIQKCIKEQNLTQYLSTLESKNLLQSDLIQHINSVLRNGDLKKQLELLTKSDESIVVDAALVVPTVVVVAFAVWVTVGIRLVAAVQWGAAVQALAEIHAAVHLSTRFYTYTTGADELHLVEDQALELYIDYSKDISMPETEEEEYIKEIREFMVETDELNSREDINTLFQLACGTTEKFLNDEE